MGPVVFAGRRFDEGRMKHLTPYSQKANVFLYNDILY